MSHPHDEAKCGELIAWEFFEAFVKKVAKNHARNLRRTLFRRMKREASQNLDEQLVVSMDKHSPNFIEIDGILYEVHNDLVYQGLMQLPEKHLHALILHFWECWLDAQIASLFGVGDRTIRKWRKQSLDKLRKTIKKGGFDEP